MKNNKFFYIVVLSALLIGQSLAWGQTNMTSSQISLRQQISNGIQEMGGDSRVMEDGTLALLDDDGELSGIFISISDSEIEGLKKVLTFCGVPYFNDALKLEFITYEYSLDYPSTELKVEDDFFYIANVQNVKNGVQYIEELDNIVGYLFSAVEDIAALAKELEDTGNNHSASSVNDLNMARQDDALSSKNILSLIDFVVVEGGDFKMGATSEQAIFADESELPVRNISLNTFEIGKYEVTQELWNAVMGSNSSMEVGDKLPVENVSWEDVQEFLSKLNAMTDNKYGFRLPTEVEWEYAARGGKMSHGYIYSGSNILSDVAYYKDNSEAVIHPVGSKAPNELGIYDMSGNVWEWCQDSFAPYSESPSPDAFVKVYRGGCFMNEASFCRVSMRGSAVKDVRSHSRGFRLVRNFIEETTKSVPQVRNANPPQKTEPSKKSSSVSRPGYISYSEVPEKPRFKGGDLNSFSSWANQMASAYYGTAGTVTVSFVIDTFGVVKDVKTVKSSNSSLSKKAISIVSMSPTWQPGKYKGERVPVVCTVTIVFK